MKFLKNMIIGLGTLLLLGGVFFLAPDMVRADVPIDEEHFPDPVFREYVKEDLDCGDFYDNDRGANDGVLSDVEIEDAYRINIWNMEIKDLTGIEIFWNIKGISCQENQLTKFDLSKNTELQELDCSNNQLTELDLSNNTNLRELDCDNNQLKKLDLSKNLELKQLQCSENQLAELDVSKCLMLEHLYCDNNQITGLDIKSTKLEYLSCNNNQLTELNVKNSSLLTGLLCHNNLLTELDVSNNTLLAKLWCDQNLLTELNVIRNSALEQLSCGGEQFVGINISYNTALTYFALKGSSEELTELDVSNNTALKEIVCSNTHLKKIDVSKNIELERLTIYDNINIKKPDLSNNKNLKYFSCDGCQLAEIDVSKNTELLTLSCNRNQLQSIDLTYNTKLQSLSYGSNKMTQPVDTSNNLDLISLSCSSNNLNTLDVSKLLDLQSLFCSSNNLSTLDVNNNTKLEILCCNNNPLIELDVSNNNLLKKLYCENDYAWNNHTDGSITITPKGFLSKLDVSHNPALRELYAWGNLLTEVDISALENLDQLDYVGNSIAYGEDVLRPSSFAFLDKNNKLLWYGYSGGIIKPDNPEKPEEGVLELVSINVNQTIGNNADISLVFNHPIVLQFLLNTDKIHIREYDSGEDAVSPIGLMNSNLVYEMYTSGCELRFRLKNLDDMKYYVEIPAGVIVSKTGEQVISYAGTGDKDAISFSMHSGYLKSTIEKATPMEYNPDLAYYLVKLAYDAYSEKEIKSDYDSKHFSNIQKNYYDDPNDPRYGGDSVAYSFGHKKIDGKNVVLITIRGSFGYDGLKRFLAKDWMSNYNIGTPTSGDIVYHAGFQKAAKNLYESLQNYIKSLGDKNDIIYFVTGHSRGAAVSNLLSKKIIDGGVAQKNVYSYNFACPDVATSLNGGFSNYNTIYNICNASDPVTALPGLLGDYLFSFRNISVKRFFNIIPSMRTWDKFGKTMYFSFDWSTIEEVAPANIGNHYQGHYVDYMQKKNTSDKFVSRETARLRIPLSGGRTIMRIFGVHCPVDIEIIDDKGQVIASVIDNKAVYPEGELLKAIILVDGDEKYIYTFDESVLTIKLKGTDSGKMDFYVIDGEFGSDIVTEKDYTSITLDKGKAMTCDLGLQDSIDQAKLYSLDENGVQKTVIAEDGTETTIDEKDKLTVEASASDHGTIYPSGKIPLVKGDSKLFTILPDDGYEIKEVLVDGKIVGKEPTYKFSDIQGNHTISASFGLPGETAEPIISATGTMKIGESTIELTATAKFPKTSVEYTGKKITAKALGATIDISNIKTAAGSLIKKGKAASLYKTAWVERNNKNAGTAIFYPKIKFDEKKAKNLKMSKTAISQMKTAIKAINKVFESKAQKITITPVDVEKNYVKTKGTISKKGKVKISYIKVKIAGETKTLSSKYYKITAKDSANKKITIQGKGKNFTGTVEIQLK